MPNISLSNQEPLKYSVSVTISLPKLDTDFLYKWSIPLFIILSVFLFNLPYLFTDTLWHDDGFWYYKASEGQFLLPWRGKVTALSPYLDCLYSYGMVYWGLPITRGVFTFVMAIASLLLYYLYRNAFGMDFKLAIPAAVIPNILPSLKGIPVGLNASYAMWGLVPILASLLILKYAFNRRGSGSRLLLGIAFGFYAIGLNLPGQPSANFLIPVVLLFCVMYFPTNKIRSILYALPFLVYGLWQIYKQFQFGHRLPASIPAAVVMDRVCQFFEMAAFLPFNKPYSLYITLGLTIFGIFGFLSMKSMLYRQPSHFNYSRNMYRLLLVCWPLCWMLANSLAYVAASEEFRAYDYAYVFNFGAVMLQMAGLVFLVALIIQWLHVNDKTRQVFIALLSIVVIFFAGFQRVQYKNHKWGWKPFLERTSQILRDNLTKNTFPNGAQILVAGEKANVGHAGVLHTNTGDIRYLLGRNDLYALIGPDKYPGNVFAPWAGWRNTMRGFNKEKPVVAFRYNGDTLDRMDLLLQVVSTGRKELPRLQWTLYDISSMQKPPRKLADGEGMSSYSSFIQNELPADLRVSVIACSPQGKPDELLDDARADQIAEVGGLLTAELNFGGHFTMRNVSAVAVEKGYELQLLLRVVSVPDKPFMLGFRINNKGWGQRVALWDFVMEGDNLLLSLPFVTEKQLVEGLSFELINIGVWLPKPLAVQGGAHDKAQAITLKKGPEP